MLTAESTLYHQCNFKFYRLDSLAAILEPVNKKTMPTQPKPRKTTKPVSEDSKIEKLIDQRDTANRGLQKILKKMNEKNENK